MKRMNRPRRGKIGDIGGGRKSFGNPSTVGPPWVPAGRARRRAHWRLRRTGSACMRARRIPDPRLRGVHVQRRVGQRQPQARREGSGERAHNRRSSSGAHGDVAPSSRRSPSDRGHLRAWSLPQLKQGDIRAYAGGKRHDGPGWRPARAEGSPRSGLLDLGGEEVDVRLASRRRTACRRSPTRRSQS